MEKGTHKGLYKSIQKTLKFFQTFALLEVSFQRCLFLYHIYLKICLLEQNQSYFAYYLLPIDSLKTSGDRDLFYAIDMWFFCLFVCLQIVHCLIGEFFFFNWFLCLAEIAFGAVVDVFFFLRNCTYFCACGWGPSEFKNLHGVARYSQYKTSKWHDTLSTWVSRKAFLLTGTQNINLTIFQEAEPLAKEGLSLDVSGIVHWLSAFIEWLWNTSKPPNWHFYSYNILSSGVLWFLKSVFLCSMLCGSLEGEGSLGENGYVCMYGCSTVHQKQTQRC